GGRPRSDSSPAGTAVPREDSAATKHGPLLAGLAKARVFSNRLAGVNLIRRRPPPERPDRRRALPRPRAARNHPRAAALPEPPPTHSTAAYRQRGRVRGAGMEADRRRMGRATARTTAGAEVPLPGDPGADGAGAAPSAFPRLRA